MLVSGRVTWAIHYCWWFRNPANLPVEVDSFSAFPIIYRVWYIQKVVQGFSNNSKVGQQANSNSKPVFNLFFRSFISPCLFCPERLMEKKTFNYQITIDRQIGLPEQLPHREQQSQWNPASLVHFLTRITNINLKNKLQQGKNTKVS